jgi:hypothetical protein
LKIYNLKWLKEQVRKSMYKIEENTMTYQELLEEFDRKRGGRVSLEQMENIEWAIAAILEKLYEEKEKEANK